MTGHVTSGHPDPLQTSVASAINASHIHLDLGVGGGLPAETVLVCGLLSATFLVVCYAIKMAVNRHLHRKLDVGTGSGREEYVDLDSLDYGLSQGGKGGLGGRVKTRLYPERWLMLFLYSLNSTAQPPSRLPKGPTLHPVLVFGIGAVTDSQNFLPCLLPKKSWI